MNILIVEDNAYQRAYLSKIIKENFLDVRVYEASTIVEAKSIIDNKRVIDLLFLDINLNGDSGLSLAKDIRKIEKYEVTPIVFISGAIAYIIEALNEVNCFDYIVKPYFEKKVLLIVEKFLKNLNKIEEVNYKFFKDINGNQIRVYYKDILFLEYYMKSCIIHTKIGAINIRANGIDNLIKEINYKSIIRTHKSYAVNLDNIKEIKRLNPKLWEVGFYDYSKKADLSYSYKSNLPIFK